MQDDGERMLLTEPDGPGQDPSVPNLGVPINAGVAHRRRWRPRRRDPGTAFTLFRFAGGAVPPCFFPALTMLIYKRFNSFYSSK